MTLEEYYGNKFPLLKQGETYLKTLMETYPNFCNKDGLQAILYIKTRIKTPESMIEKLKRHGMKEDSQTALQHIHDALGVRVICSFIGNCDFWKGKEEQEFIEYMSDKLLHKQAEELFFRLVEQMKWTQGITERLKEENALEWVQRMNNIQACAREIVEEEIIYI